MNHTPVESSNLKSIAYDADEQRLQVAFKNGTLFEYEMVPPRVFEAFAQSTSKGTFFARRIRYQYNCKPVQVPKA